MTDVDARLARMLDLLDAAGSGSDTAGTGTSVRLPNALKQAAALASELGLAESASELIARGLHGALVDLAQRAMLDDHYRLHPDSRPELAEVTIALAQIDGDPLGSNPRVIRKAITHLRTAGREPTPDEVLLFAGGLVAGAA